MYKITVIMMKPGVKDNLPSPIGYGKSVEEVKSQIKSLALKTAREHNVSGEMYIGTIIEEHGAFFDSDEADAFISKDFKNITYKL